MNNKCNVHIETNRKPLPIETRKDFYNKGYPQKKSD